MLSQFVQVSYTYLVSSVPVIAIMRLITANEVFDLAVRHEMDPNVVLDLTCESFENNSAPYNDKVFELTKSKGTTSMLRFGHL